MKHVGDITKLNGAELEPVDVITGGSPCQDLSVAGKRAGLDGERSGLLMEQIRVIKEMREHDKASGRTDEFIRPRYMVWENVIGAFSSNGGEDFRCVLEETARIVEPSASIPRPDGKWTPSGCIMGDGWSIAWRVHDAQFWGVPQRRKRIALVADFGGQTAPEILFERKGVSRNTEPSGKEGEGVAADVRSGIEEASRAISFQERAGKSGGGKGILIQDERTGALSTLNNQSVCYLNDQGGSQMGVTEDITGTLRAGEHGHQPIVLGISSYDSNAMKSDNPHSGIYEAYTSRTLDNNGGSPACNQGGMAIVYDWHRCDTRMTELKDVCCTASAAWGSGGNNMPMVMETYHCNHENDLAITLKARDYKDPQCVAYGLDRASYNQGKNAKFGFSVDKEKIGAQTSKGPGAVCQSVVRRLTPLECERLQGFPDGWTDIGEWIDSKGKKHKPADSPRYKALGNSIALPFWFYLLRRISAQYERPATLGSLFDGIGGFPLCWERCNGKGTAIWASEIEEFPIAVTKKHFPEEE